jgi:hypothetical protein
MNPSTPFVSGLGAEVISPPKLPLQTMFRLGLFQMALGMMSILTLGVLNRILIDQEFLAVPATLAGGALAMYQFVSPARVWFGQLSDAKPWLGYHRTAYIWCGSILFALCAFGAVQVIWRLAATLETVGWGAIAYGWVALLALMFALYGLCISSCSTPFAALLVDVSDEENRSKLVGIVWAMLMVGIVLGAVSSGFLLKSLTPENLESSINQLFIAIPACVVGLIFTATAGVEKRYSRYRFRSAIAGREDQVTLKTALKVLTASRQTGFFFCFLGVMTLGPLFAAANPRALRRRGFWHDRRTKHSAQCLLGDWYALWHYPDGLSDCAALWQTDHGSLGLSGGCGLLYFGHSCRADPHSICATAKYAVPGAWLWPNNQ